MFRAKWIELFEVYYFFYDK